MADPAFRTILFQEPESAHITIAASIHSPPNPVPQQATFLLLPFWGGSAETYSSIQHNLRSKCPNNTSIAISYRGTGKASTPTDIDPAHHSIEALTTDLTRFLHSPELSNVADVSRLIICAHSMSAKIALRLACTLDPGAVGVQSLLLLAPAPPGPLVLPPDVREGQLTAYESYDSALWTINNVLSHTRLDDSVTAPLAQSCVGMSPGAKKGWVELGMAESITHLLEEGRRGVEVRVLAGARDQVETLERVREGTVGVLRACGWEGVGVRVLEGCGHLVPLERGGEVVGELVTLARI
ncbi:MAG: hypothetical protein Q9195_008795 [Heterodermia aff. obscurata]